MQTNQDNSLKELHKSCETLPLSRFITCICDNDLSALIISGKHNVAELQNAWIDIYSEFVDLTETADKKAMFRLFQNILELKIKHLRVSRMVQYMAVQWDEDFVNELRGMNFRYKYDTSRPNEYSKDLNMIMTRIKSWLIEIALLEDEYNAYEEKNKGEQPKRIYFIQSLVRLAKWQGGGRIDPDKTTVAEYCMIKNDYHNYYDVVNKESNAKH